MKRSSSSKPVGIVLLGGAGTKKPSKHAVSALAKIAQMGYEMLEAGMSAIDTVEKVIVFLEDDPVFNAGTGSRLQLDGVPRMDASIMEGDHFRAGAVASVENIRNPIKAARAVMENTDHVMLAGEGARKFALACGIEEVDVRTAKGIESWKRSLRATHKHVKLSKYFDSCETVGAVALDREGQLASGSSTGGAPYMLPGRVGDTPIIGSGIYADSRIGAVSATGVGEYIVRMVLSKAVVDLISGGMHPARAVKTVITRLNRITGGRVGAIAIDTKVRPAVWHNTDFMSYAYKVKGGKVMMGEKVK
jgi:beta-aspartyl-peptidase (threonine type)